MRPRIIILCIVVALAAWLATLYLAFMIPGSPFRAIPGVVERLSDPRTGPGAFNEFLALGERTKLIGAIAFPLVAGLAVAVLSRLRVRLKWSEAMIVVVVFSAFLFIWSGGIGYFGLADLASIGTFMLSVALGIRWQRHPTAV
jgi:hypothetical protein